uniref:Coiled-coil domain containing 127 n=1 Tax=Mus musculus TaxID=10090 RepID=E0CXT2_MOUSE
MNNLNDPPNWNIRPNARADGGDGSKWNYALLVPMLGLAAFQHVTSTPAVFSEEILWQCCCW